MASAFLLPRILKQHSDRTVMLAASTLLCGLLAALGIAWPLLVPTLHWPLLLVGWLLLGASYAAVVTPGGRLLRRSSKEADRPALFAAQFSLSHACWLIAYPVVGWLGAKVGITAAIWAMAALAVLGLLLARGLWPREESEVIEHHHHDLPPNHPHLAGQPAGRRHAHVFVIDEQHAHWPSR